MTIDTRQHPFWTRLSSLKKERSSFEGHWREIGEYMAPGRFRDLRGRENDGRKKYSKIIDETANFARRTFVAGFMAGLTSPARPWFKLVPPDHDMLDQHDVKEWLEVCERRIRLVLQRSNFYQAVPNVYDDLGTFGTGAVSVVEDDQAIAWFHPHPVGEYWVAASDRNVVDTMYRHTTKTVQQLVQSYGKDAVSVTTKTLYEKDALDTRVPVIQAIEPNDDRRDYKDFKNMPWRSVWFEEGAESRDKFLAMRGFNEFPSMAPRWYAASTDVYGVDCPGMLALGGVKQLQHEQKRKGQAIDLLVRPPLQAPSGLEAKGVANLLPGGITFYDEQGPNAGLRPIYEVQPRLNEMVGDIAEVQERINRSFYVDMFLMISRQDDVRTATEIALRNEEKLLMLGPVLQRVHTELLDPIIDRVFSIMARNNLLPEPPEALQGADLRVEYISMLAQAQQSVGSNSIERFLGVAGNMAAVNEAALDKVDFDEVLDEYGSILGVPQRLIRADEDVAALRRARAVQQQAGETLERVGAGAKAAKVLSDTRVDEDTALSRALSGLQ